MTVPKRRSITGLELPQREFRLATPHDWFIGPVSCHNVHLGQEHVGIKLISNLLDPLYYSVSAASSRS